MTFPKRTINWLCVVIGVYFAWTGILVFKATGFSHPRALLGAVVGTVAFATLGISSRTNPPYGEKPADKVASPPLDEKK